jgi:hypothetical protein
MVKGGETMNDYVVQVAVQVRAEGTLEAAEAAFSQLRDMKRGTFEAIVQTGAAETAGQTQRVLLDAAKGTARAAR